MARRGGEHISSYPHILNMDEVDSMKEKASVKQMGGKTANRRTPVDEDQSIIQVITFIGEEKTLIEQKTSSGEKPAKQKSSDVEKPVEKTPMEEDTPDIGKPVKLIPMEEKTPDIEKPVEKETPMEENAPDVEKPVEKTPMEETTDIGKPVKWIPMEESTPDIEKPVKLTPTEEKTGDEKPVKETAMEENTPDVEMPVEKTPEDQITAPGDNKTPEDTPVEGKITVEVKDAVEEMKPASPTPTPPTIRPFSGGEGDQEALKNRWELFCRDVIVVVEDKVITIIGELRPALDKANAHTELTDGDGNIREWTFSFTVEARDYLVYNMLDTVFGFAKHGAGMKEVLGTDDFRKLVKFLMEEEMVCFLQMDLGSKEEYYNQLSNRMLMLTPLAELPVESGLVPGGVIPDDDIPLDPVDALFHYYGSQEERRDKLPSANHTLNTLLQRTEIPKEKRESMLSKMKTFKVSDVRLGMFEKRFDKLVVGIKSVTHQMLHNPMEGESMVVNLFGYTVYFLAPENAVKTPVRDFLTTQKALAARYGPGDKDRADADACMKFPNLIPLMKEETSMPESLLLNIEACIKRHKSAVQESEAEDDEKPASETIQLDIVEAEENGVAGDHSATNGVMHGDSSPQTEPARQQERQETEVQRITNLERKVESMEMKEEKAESTAKSPEIISEAETMPMGVEAFFKEMLSLPPPSQMTDIIEAADGAPSEPLPGLARTVDDAELKARLESLANRDECFELLKGRLNLRRCLFSVRNPDMTDYYCPVLGYLPLLPVVDFKVTVLPLKKVNPAGDVETKGDSAGSVPKDEN